MRMLATTAVLASLIWGASAEAQLRIKDPYSTSDRLDIGRITVLDEFSSKLNIGKLEEPRFATSLGAGKLVAAYAGTSILTGAITHAVFDKPTGMVLGVVGGRLVFTGTLPDGAIKVLVTDARGGVLEGRQIVAIDSATSTPICLKQTPISQVPGHQTKMAFSILVDRSGSMMDVMDDVRKAVRNLLGLLPDNALCEVIGFNHRWEQLGPGSRQPCRADRFDFDKLNADGGTDIYSPLSAVYETYRKSAFDGWQRGVFVITDGQLGDDLVNAEQRRRALAVLKEKAFTTVFWHGNNAGAAKHFVGLADAYLASGGDLKALLSASLGLVGEQYRGQVVLTRTACPVPKS